MTLLYSTACPGTSGVHLSDNLHCRNLSKNSGLRSGHAPQLLHPQRLEPVGLCHCHCGVCYHCDLPFFLCVSAQLDSPSFAYLFSSLLYIQLVQYLAVVFFQYNYCYLTCPSFFHAVIIFYFGSSAPSPPLDHSLLKELQKC